jgi:hypothetical protein
MPTRTFVRCVDCRRRSSAVVDEDGSITLPTPDSRCRCGCEEFVELDGLLSMP